MLKSWVGQREYRLINNWGPPDKIYRLPEEGMRILMYLDDYGSNAVSQYGYGTRYWHFCRTFMMVNTDGVITDWTWKGNQCKRK